MVYVVGVLLFWDVVVVVVLCSWLLVWLGGVGGMVLLVCG